jgi:hypothetical protein
VRKLIILGTMLAMMLLAASPAFAHTVNVQESVALFGDQTAVQVQVDSDGSAQLAFQGQLAAQSQWISSSGGSWNSQFAGAAFGDQFLLQQQVGSDGSLQAAFQGQAAFQSQSIWAH